MPFAIQASETGLQLELAGSLTVRHAQELGQSLALSALSGMSVTVRIEDLEDIDTSILQVLVSLRKSSSSFVIQEYSEPFISAVERCALRRELLSESKELA